MAKNSFVPKVNVGLPAGHKVPLQQYMQQLTPKGMTPAQMRHEAMVVQTGNGGLPVGAGKSR